MTQKQEKNKFDLEKTGPEPVFNIYRMPKGYKIGRFEAEKIDSKEKTGEGFSSQEKHKHNKKIGAVIIVFGVIFVVLLGYIVFSYISNPNFKLVDVLKFNNKSSLEKQSDNTLLDNSNMEDKFKEEIIGDDLNGDDSLGEEVSEDEIDNLINTSTEEEIIEVPVEENINYSFVDNDGDGLSDSEETILGTDFFKTDSDGDSYDDLTEALNLYNPAGSGKLINNSNVSKYQNNSFAYNILYPTIWDKNVLSDESSIIFSINSNSFVQVLVEENETGANIKNWYTSRFFTLVDSANSIENENWEGVYSEDGLAVYLTNKQKSYIYTILYTVPEGQPQSYINIFKIIVNSFLVNL